MLLDVSLAGHTAAWSFGGSVRFSDWANARPWLNDGGFCVLRTAGRNFEEELFSAVVQLVHGLHGGEGTLEVCRIECGGVLGSPVSALLRKFEQDPSLGIFAAKANISQRHRICSYVLVFMERGAVSADQWEELVILCEHYGKSVQPLRLCAVIFDSSGAVTGAQSFDYMSGRAFHRVLTGVPSTRDPLCWGAYLHHRIGWEAGGNYDYALSLSEELRGTPLGDDNELERRLQAHALSCFQRGAAADSLRDYLRLGEANSGMGHPLATRLLMEQLMWRSPGWQSPRIVPWAARALLVDRRLPKQQIWTLRHHLICAPLASEILGLCLQFESQIRAKLHDRVDVGKMKQETADNQQRYLDGQDEVVVYPQHFPAPPDGPEDRWAFASLGEVLRSCPPGAVSGAHRSTLHLRNALAHGHYVGWRHIELAIRQLNVFDVLV